MVPTIPGKIYPTSFFGLMIVPVGLVFDPKDIPFPHFSALVAFICHGGDMYATSWMENPVLLAWYSAACLCPTSLGVPAITHSAFIRYFPSSLPPAAISILKHQRWSILSHILWDRIFGLGSWVAIKRSRFTVPQLWIASNKNPWVVRNIGAPSTMCTATHLSFSWSPLSLTLAKRVPVARISSFDGHISSIHG
jgi:hypothetical protein